MCGIVGSTAVVEIPRYLLRIIRCFLERTIRQMLFVLAASARGRFRCGQVCSSPAGPGTFNSEPGPSEPELFVSIAWNWMNGCSPPRSPFWGQPDHTVHTSGCRWSAELPRWGGPPARRGDVAIPPRHTTCADGASGRGRPRLGRIAVNPQITQTRGSDNRVQKRRRQRPGSWRAWLRTLPPASA